jgi:hypothetical protein
MKFQVNTGWPVGQFLIPASTIIDIGDKPEHELSEYERLARGRIPPLDAVALDADAAIAIWRAYPFHRDRLYRQLDETNEATFARLVALSEGVLARYWQQGKG